VLTVHDGPDQTAPRIDDRLCGLLRDDKFEEVTSSNVMYLHFRTDDTLTGPGFVGLASVVV